MVSWGGILSTEFARRQQSRRWPVLDRFCSPRFETFSGIRLRLKPHGCRGLSVAIWDCSGGCSRARNCIKFKSHSVNVDVADYSQIIILTGALQPIDFSHFYLAGQDVRLSRSLDKHSTGQTAPREWVVWRRGGVHRSVFAELIRVRAASIFSGFKGKFI
jgi:hypothetical protein